jgi:hypothetical protein
VCLGDGRADFSAVESTASTALGRKGSNTHASFSSFPSGRRARWNLLNSRPGAGWTCVAIPLFPIQERTLLESSHPGDIHPGRFSRCRRCLLIRCSSRAEGPSSLREGEGRGRAEGSATYAAADEASPTSSHERSANVAGTKVATNATGNHRLGSETMCSKGILNMRALFAASIPALTWGGFAAEWAPESRDMQIRAVNFAHHESERIP